MNRWHWHNFDGQTRLAIVTALVLAGVWLAAVVKEPSTAKGHEHDTGIQAVDSNGTANSQGAVGIDGVLSDAREGAGVHVGRVDRVQRGQGGLCHERRPADTRRGSDARWHAVQIEVSRDTRRLFDAIRQVESGGNDAAVGDGGKSVGPYQCGQAAFIDGGGNAADWPRLAYSRVVVEAVMVRYWARYGAVTDEQRARIWNGGPRGMSKHSTLAYWRKVRCEIEQEIDQ